jgi:DNA-binding CsgD family transcriptional regulator
MVHLNNVDDFALNFVNGYGEEQFETTTEEIIQTGGDFVLDLYEPGGLSLFTQPLIQMIEENDKSKVLSFFQKIKPNKNVDYRWVLTSSKILKNKNEFISISQPINGIETSSKAITRLLDENLYLRQNMNKFGSLTKREKEILKLVVKGYSSKQIADALFISHHTVTTHRKNIGRKIELDRIRDWECFADAFDLL